MFNATPMAVLLDWPTTATGGAVPRVDAEPGVVLEQHEHPVLAGPGENPPPPANAFLVPVDTVDLSPFHVEVENGQFAFNGATAGFEANGIIRMGFAPGDGETFQPQLRVDGSAFFNDEILRLEGTISLEIGGFSGPLLSGVIEINLQQVATSLVNEVIDDLENDLNIAGVELSVSRIDFVNPEGNGTQDARLEIEGSLSLPDWLSGVTLAIQDPNKIVIDAHGISITGGAIEFPDADFDLGGVLRGSATGMAVTYLSEPEEALRIQGALALPDVFNVVADFAGDNYIQISELGLTVIGTLSIENVPLIPGVWEINRGSLTIDTDQDLVQGEASLRIPTGIDVLGGLGFLQGDLNFLSLGVSNLNKPIGATGAFLQSISGAIDNIAPAATEPINFTGGVGVTAGPNISISLPSFLGGDVGGALVELNVSGTIDIEHLEATGDLIIAGGLVSGTATAELNWTEGFLSATAALDALDGAIAFSGGFRADSRFNITMNATSSVSIPNSFPVIGGTQLASGNAYFQYRNDASSFNDFVAGWGTYSIPLVGTVFGGLRVRFDGSWATLGINEISEITGSPEGESDRAGEGEGGAVESGQFVVPAGAEFVLLSADWDNATSNTTIVLIGPDGTEFDEAAIAAASDMAIVDDLTSQTRRTVVVTNPAAGNWRLRLPMTTGLGQVRFSAVESASAPPTINLTGSAADTADSLVAIDFSAFDSDSNATVDFYFDTDRRGFNGQLIAGGIVETDGSSSFNWDTTNVPTGNYYIYAVIQDEDNPPIVSAYAPGRVSVLDLNASAAPQGLVANWLGGDAVEVRWDEVAGADFYRVSYTADASGEYYDETAVTDGAETRAVVLGLEPGEAYRFMVQAVKSNATTGLVEGVSPPSPPAVGIIGPAQTVAEEGDQWSVFAVPGSTFSAAVSVLAGDVLTIINAPPGATVDSQTGEFTFDVSGDSSGFANVVINIAHAGGGSDQVRRVLLTDAFVGQIAGQKFIDADGDGTKAAGEVGESGVTIELLDATTSEVLRSTTTVDEDLDQDNLIDPRRETGSYRFTELAPGYYKVRVVRATGTEPTTDDVVTVLVSGHTREVLFGDRRLLGSIHGTKFDDANANQGRDDGEAGVAGRTIFVDVNGDGELGTYEVTAVANDTPVDVTDVATVSSTIHLGGLPGTIANVELTVDIEHEYLGDLVITLVSPRGTRILLVANVGVTSGRLEGTIFNNTSATLITAGVSPFESEFRPLGRLADVAGEDPNGVWTLDVRDDESGDVGTLNGWSLRLVLAEPTTQTMTDDLATVENEAGRYRLEQLPAGVHRVVGVVPAGFVQTFPANGQLQLVTVVGGEASEDIDFGDRENAFPWQNARNRLDVNDDGFVVPLDVLLIINELNARSIIGADGRLPAQFDPLIGFFFDVNADGFVSPLDALIIINFLNDAFGGEGEVARFSQVSVPATPVAESPVTSLSNPSLVNASPASAASSRRFPTASDSHRDGATPPAARLRHFAAPRDIDEAPLLPLFEDILDQLAWDVADAKDR